MRSSSRPSVVLFAGPETLSAVDSALRRAGLCTVRITSWTAQPVDPSTWYSRLARRPGVDTAVVTSRTGVEMGVRPWRRRNGPFPDDLEFWAVGPGTARALRTIGLRRIRRPPFVGTVGIAKVFRARPPRRIAYFRSDAAGPELARRLRKCGHRVVDVVAYRTLAAPKLSSLQRRRFRDAELLVVTSPSGLRFLREALGEHDFDSVARTVPLVVLGERSRQAAQRLRFRRVWVAPGTAPQRFTRFVMRELRHGHA